MTTLKSVPTVEVRHLVLVDNYILAVGPGLTFAEFVISAVLLSLYVPLATYCCVRPLGIDGLAGETVIDTSVTGVTVKRVTA